MMLRASEPPLKSLDVALRVLEALDNGAPERGISDLARELGVSRAAVYRILSTLSGAATSLRIPPPPSTPSDLDCVGSAMSPPANLTCKRWRVPS